LSALTCDAARRLVSPYLDGELVGEDRAAFLAHVEGCASCRRLLADEEAVVDAVRRAIERPLASEALRARIEGTFDGEWRRRLRRDWIAAAVAAVLLAGMGIAGAWRVRAVDGPVPAPRPDASDDLAALTADTHLRYTRGQLPLEVDSSRPEEVSGFFAGRVPFHLALPDYPVGPGESKPYRMLGGRLVSFRGDYAAYVAYRLGDRPISLLVTSAQLAQPRGGETVGFGPLVFHQRSVQGLEVITWTDKGLTYSLASDLSVSGAQSCAVCHGSLEERRRLEGFPPRT
jgi:anti-sigma factor RsiW